MKNIFKLLAVVMALALFTACSDDDNNTTEPTPTADGELTIQSQRISQNEIVVEKVTFKEDGWIVVHADDNNSPVVPDIISVAVPVEAGTHEDLIIPLSDKATMLDGNTNVWVMLHTDNGVKGSYEFDGESGIDGPLKGLDSAIIMKKILVQPATITVDDQNVTNNTVSIVSVTATVDGWIVIHNDDGNGNIVVPGIIGKAKVSKGLNENIEITLDEGVVIEQGQKLFPMLHIDNKTLDKYEFPVADPAEVFGFDDEGNPKVILKTITVL